MKTTYYLLPEKRKLPIGHSMCCGAFPFNGGNDYDVVFEFMDASGNHGCERTKPILVTRPETKFGKK